MNFKNHLSSYSAVFMTSLSSKTLHDKLSFNCRGFRIVEKWKKNHFRQWEQYNKRNGQKSEVNVITVALLEYNMLVGN